MLEVQTGIRVAIESIGGRRGVIRRRIMEKRERLRERGRKIQRVSMWERKRGRKGVSVSERECVGGCVGVGVSVREKE